jgi:two-component sensor histidine kinase
VRWIRDRAYPIHGPDGAVSRIVGVADDITETKRAETALRRNNQLQQLLLSELDHRVKNSLAGLLTLIDLSASDQPTVEEFARSMRDRVAALASAHALLSDAHWQPVGIRAMLSRLMPPGTPGAFDLAGPEAMIPARQATALAMIFQELITNSIKHGAASSPAGRTAVSWSVTRFELSGSVERRFTPQGAGYRFTFQLDPVPEPPDPPSAAPSPIPASVATE